MVKNPPAEKRKKKKNPSADTGDARDASLIPGSGRFPGEENGNIPLQYSCLENPMNGRAWWATVHGVAKSTHTPKDNNN